MNNVTHAISLFVHLSATTLWLGGIFITLMLVLPIVRTYLHDSPALYRVLSKLRQRFYPISNLCLVALIVTGAFQMTASPYYDGFLTFDNLWSQIMLLKHALIVLMALAGLGLQYGVAPALERTSLLLEKGKGGEQSTHQWQTLRQRETFLSWVLASLGLAILLCSAGLGAL